MAIKRWIGGSVAVSQITTATVTSAVPGNTYYLMVGEAYTNWTVSYVAVGGDTTTSIATALTALWNASTDPAFADATATSVGAVITLESTPGLPVTISGSAEITVATTRAATGPEFWDNGKNWFEATIPATGDIVYVDNSEYGIKYNISQFGTTLLKLNVTPKAHAIPIGLNTWNSAGYREYRTLNLQCGITSLWVPNCTNLMRFNTGAVSCQFLLENATTTSSGYDSPIWWLGINATNALIVQGGSLAIGPLANQVAVVASLRQSGGTIYLGHFAAVTDWYKYGGTATVYGTVTTLHQSGVGGSSYMYVAPTNANLRGGTLDLRNTVDPVTLTAVTVGDGGVLQCSKTPARKTITTLTLERGATITDWARTLTITNPIVYSGCTSEHITWNYGNTKGSGA